LGASVSGAKAMKTLMHMTFAKIHRHCVLLTQCAKMYLGAIAEAASTALIGKLKVSISPSEEDLGQQTRKMQVMLSTRMNILLMEYILQGVTTLTRAGIRMASVP